MRSTSETLIIGKVGAPYGVKGWVKINSFTQVKEDIFAYLPWALTGAGIEQQTYHIDQWRTQGKGLIAKVVGIESRDDAELIKNADITIDAALLPKLDGDYYWKDLMGMQVVTEQGYDLGTVKDMFETGANDVMLVRANSNDAFGQKERLLPFLHDSVIKQVNEQNRTITVDWDPAF